ncbi:M48 family metallopeptidase [Roseateles sp.]|jgi:Zn-dependent protease with chaperone function|uniref:M48 family metallopeptidase n=1 Tax=Roseateles sp. TaxID=1971397 RepID=UPI0031CFC63D
MRSRSQTGTGRWFDGAENRPQEVRVRLSRNHLEFMPWPPRPQAATASPPSEAELAASQPSLPGLRRYARSKLQVGEWWRDSATPVGLPDGGTLWIPAGHAMGRQLGGQSLGAQMIGSWVLSLCGLILLILLVAWFDRQGAGLLARAALPLVPTKLDQAVGNEVEEQIEHEWLKPSQLPERRQKEIVDRFDDIASRVFPGVPLDVRFARQGDRAGFNAMALPNGTIIVFDGLAEALTDDELMAVLGHEAGHVKHRHAMRQVVQGIGLLSVAGVVLGDFSTVAAGSMASLQALRYSRNAERESDAEAQRLILREHLPNETLVGAWSKLREEMRREGRSDRGAEWLSTHPPIAERIESARQAAQNADPVR